VLEFEVTQPIESLHIDLIIGGEMAHGTDLVGQIDELRIWNRALSQGDIRANMYSSFRAPAPGLVVHYTFDGLDSERI